MITVFQHWHIAPPGTESKTIRDLLLEDLDTAVDYKATYTLRETMGPHSTPLRVMTTPVVHRICTLDVVLRTR